MCVCVCVCVCVECLIKLWCRVWLAAVMGTGRALRRGRGCGGVVVTVECVVL